MTAARAAAAVPLLLLLLTWLLLRGMNLDAPTFDRALAGLDRFAMLESALRRDLLLARAGMLHNYDRLVRDVNGLEEGIDPLRDAATAAGVDTAGIEQLATVVNEEQELIEQFKSDNALLQNSLAYFGMFSAQFGSSIEGRPALPAVSALAAAMLRFTLDTSPATATEVEERLDALEAASAGDTGSIHGMVAHGRMVHRVLPATDRLLNALLVVPSNREIATIRSAILAHQVASRTTSERFRILLYGTSLLLLGLLVDLGLRLRARALALQRRAAFEHVTTGISTGFINSRSDEIDALVGQALAELAASLGADRAYFASAGTSPRIHAWCRQDAGFPPGWPSQAPSLVSRFEPTGTGLVHVSRVDRLPPGTTRNALTAARLRGWACISGQGGSSVLGFDALRPGLITRSVDLGFLRTAFDVIANAMDRKSFEYERVRLETSLQQSRRMETVGTFASGIAHNFNNIVGAILGYTEMAEAQVLRDTAAALYLGEIRRAGDRARDLIDQILTFGRRRDVRLTPVNVSALMLEAKSLLEASLPPQIKLVVRADSEGAIVSGDPAQLQQVVLNLCNNAAQAMDGVGQIDVETQYQEIARPLALTDGELGPGRYVRIDVKDSGCGMDESVKTRIFEPFFTTRLVGNGLGLATVREIVRAHRGMMNVVSAPGTGSRMEVWLPSGSVAMPAPDERKTIDRHADGSPSERHRMMLPFGRGETVLLVDVERRRLLQDEEMLAALGYEPVGFTRPDDAISAHRMEQKRFDAMVVCHTTATWAMDVAAPLKHLAPRLPIVLATISAGEIDANGLAAVGIAEVVRYPLLAAEIAMALQRCIVAPQNSLQ